MTITGMPQIAWGVANAGLGAVDAGEEPHQSRMCRNGLYDLEEQESVYPGWTSEVA